MNNETVCTFNIKVCKFIGLPLVISPLLAIYNQDINLAFKNINTL